MMFEKEAKAHYRIAVLELNQESIIAQFSPKKQEQLPFLPTFWLHFHVKGNGTEWIDEKMPTPNYLLHSNNGGYFIGWQINGYFGTKKGADYLNDIIGRITISLNECKPVRQLYKPDMRDQYAHYFPKIHRLLEFRDIKSLSKKVHAPVRADNLGGKDYCFWAIKLYTEDLIRQVGEGTPVPSHMIEDWAYNQFPNHKKGISTVRAKCRSIWNWNDKRDWQLPKSYERKYTDEELRMSREDHIKKVNENKKLKTQAKIKAIIEDMFVQDQIKTKAGKFKAKAIADLLELDQRTVSTHLKEMGLV